MKMTSLIFILLIAFGSQVTGEINVTYVNTFDDAVTAPTAISVTPDRMAVLEPYQSRLKLFSADGLLQYKINLPKNAGSLFALVENTYLFADYSEHKVMHLSVTTGEQSDLLNGRHSFINLSDLTVYNDFMYVLDGVEKSITKYSISSGSIQTIQLGTFDSESITHPSALVYAPSVDRFFVTSQKDGTIWVFDNEGQAVDVFGSFGGGAGQLTRIGDIAIGSNGLLYISDRFQNRVVVYTLGGEYVGMIDRKTVSGGTMNVPIGLVVDENDLLYITSAEGNTVETYHVSYIPKYRVFHPTLLYPELNDTLPASNFHISAAVSSEEPDLITGFEFEIFTSSDTQSVLEASSLISPEAMYDSVTQRWQYSAEWREMTSNVAGSYYWRARVNTTEAAGEWSSFSGYALQDLPGRFKLYQNYPNPFNPMTTINFDLPRTSSVKLRVYNILGQETAVLLDETREAGYHEVQFSADGLGLSSGIYFYRLETDKNIETRKMVLIK